MTKKKDPKDYLKRGRPTDYRPEYCEKVIEFGKLGYSKAEIALELDVDRGTLDNWLEEHPDFFTAMAKSQDFCKAWWLKSGRENVDNRSYNSHLYSLHMQNRFGWNKKTEVTGNIKVTHEEALKELE